MSGEVFLEVLSICYNRTGAFLLAGIYLIKYDCEFVILLVRLTVFRCFSVFHPLWLVLFHTVDVSSLSVDVVCHCFCSPCCDLCAAAWVTIIKQLFPGRPIALFGDLTWSSCFPDLKHQTFTCGSV